MIARPREFTVWRLAVAVGLLALGSAGSAWAKQADSGKQAAAKDADKKQAVAAHAEQVNKAETPVVGEKDNKQVAEKTKKPVAKEAGKDKASKKAEPDKAKQGKTRKGSFLTRLLQHGTGGNTIGTVKIRVRVQSEPSGKEKKNSQENKTAKKTEKPKKTPQVVCLKLRGSYPESPEALSPFGSQTTSLYSLLTKFKQLSEDDNVAAVVLEIETSELGGAKINEIRHAVRRLRQSGKRVYAFVTSVDNGRYLLASACDEVLMVPSGIMMIPGVRAEVTFYKGLLDKIGVKFEVLQMGKYKGAGEPMSRAKMSGPLRESMEAVLDDRYEWFVRTVAADRKMEGYKVKTLVDEAFFMASTAKKAGLVDQVVYLDVFLKTLPKTLKVDAVKVVTDYKTRRTQVDLSGIGGMMKLMQMMVGGNKTEGVTRGKKIALVYAVGAIVEGKSSEGLFGDKALGSTTLVEALKKADEDPNVVAIVLRVDSPGGSGVASDLIWRETRRINKPIIASMGDVAGSGGYYISMGADKIYAEPGTITGSIGVIGGKLVMGDLFKKIGVTTDVISRGKRSGALSPMNSFTPDEREGMMSVMRAFYRQFVTKAAEGRDMSYDELHALAQGRIYSGEDAVELGLVDALGTLDDAIAAAKKAAGLKKSEKVELIVLPRPKTFFEQLFEDPSASTDAMMKMAGPLGETLGDVRVIERLTEEPILLWMPYRVEVR
ncbi:MAG TPA: signal peptide peptidase SppA [Thermoguttaceae bacterium]|nr:signal peptide peptidase SppA [Thermoguttaceae bacterium]